MKKSLLLTILCLPFMAQANDSTGTVSTGGVEYIKNEHIAKTYLSAKIKLRWNMNIAI